jgi:hypothetical protein
MLKKKKKSLDSSRINNQANKNLNQNGHSYSPINNSNQFYKPIEQMIKYYR